MMQYQKKIAKALLHIEAVKFKLLEPITFKSGILSPVYVDNRIFPFYPKEWNQIIESFAELIKGNRIEFDVIGGIETAGIPHSAALGFYTKKPSIFIRKKVKDHGTKSRIEGGTVQSQRVLLIEDHITTGGSSLSGVEALAAIKVGKNSQGMGLIINSSRGIIFNQNPAQAAKSMVQEMSVLKKSKQTKK